MPGPWIAGAGCASRAASHAGCATASSCAPTIISRPVAERAGTAGWPTLLMRQPYGRDIASTVVYRHPAWFARHGYHVIIQDVRGRGDSEGEFYPFRFEAEDGFDTIAVGGRPARQQRPRGHVRLFLPGGDPTAGGRGAAARPGVHRSGDDGVGLLSRLVLSTRGAPAGLDARMGNPDAQGRRPPAESARGQRRAGSGLGEPARRALPTSARRSRGGSLCRPAHVPRGLDCPCGTG